MGLSVNLTKPPHPDTLHSALYFLIHAAHRKTAIDAAIAVLHDQARTETTRNGSAQWAEATTIATEWVVESLIQGAWLREYHQWEIATKAYIQGQYARSLGVPVSEPALWRGGGSHVDKVKHQLGLFNATPPACIAAIDATREQVNAAKHCTDLFVDRGAYDALIATIEAFWQALDEQEAFTIDR
jgi:hypothetical protein